MTNKELMRRFNDGDESALDELCTNNRALICDRAEKMAFGYNSYRVNDRGTPTAYTIELLSDLEGEGLTALIACIRSGGYDASKGEPTTYTVPFIDGAMRRYLETSLGSFSIDRDSMTLVRRAQELYHVQRKSEMEIADALGVSREAASRYIGYATHFFSVYDCVKHNDDEDNLYDDDIYDRLAEDTTFKPPHEAVYRKLRIEHLREQFMMLPRKERDILGKCFGAFGYPRTPLEDIGIYHLMKVDAVEKTRIRALGLLKKRMREHPNPWALATEAIRLARRECSVDMEYSTPQDAWYEDERAMIEPLPELVQALIEVDTVFQEKLEAEKLRRVW